MVPKKKKEQETKRLRVQDKLRVSCKTCKKRNVLIPGPAIVYDDADKYALAGSL